MKISGSLTELLDGISPPIHIVDIGALWLGEGNQVYLPLLATRNVRVVGFEPIVEECDSLNLRFGPSHTYLPYAIADGTKRLFHRCNFAMTSSLYEPDLVYMNQFEDLACYCQVISVDEMQTIRLDDVKAAYGADYLKIDVQGAELDVLKGAVNILRNISVVQLEVEFVPIYRKQPLFADVDQFLRSQGFMFHRFVNMESRTLQSRGGAGDSAAHGQQLLWSDAVYIRNILAWDQLPSDTLLKLALILHEMYQAFDFSARLLHLHDQKTGGTLHTAYLDTLRQQARAVGD